MHNLSSVARSFGETQPAALWEGRLAAMEKLMGADALLLGDCSITN